MSTAKNSGLAPGDEVILQIDEDELRGQRVIVAEVYVHDGEEFITFLHPRAHDDDWDWDSDPWRTVPSTSVLPVRAS
jgi:hypothetical protein